MGRGLRPTSSVVLNAIFNIVGNVQGMDLLDLFAGTGRVGLKAVEKEASSVIWVEKHRVRAHKIQKRIEKMPKGNYFVLCMDVRAAVRYLFKSGRVFDIIFMDPPYGKAYVERTCEYLRVYNILRNNGILVAEYRVGDVNKELVREEYRYGDSAIGILNI